MYNYCSNYINNSYKIQVIIANILQQIYDKLKSQITCIVINIIYYIKYMFVHLKKCNIYLKTN